MSISTVTAPTPMSGTVVEVSHDDRLKVAGDKKFSAVYAPFAATNYLYSRQTLESLDGDAAGVCERCGLPVEVGAYFADQFVDAYSITTAVDLEECFDNSFRLCASSTSELLSELSDYHKTTDLDEIRGLSLSMLDGRIVQHASQLFVVAG